MIYLTRGLKGQAGYINKQRNFEIIKTLLLFIMALGIFFIGYINLGTKKNLWTVIAILATLPACKSFVGVIMLCRYNSLSKDKIARYKSAIVTLSALYENIITTSEKSYFVPVICCENNTLICLLDKKKDEDIKKLTEHLNFVMNNAGHKVSVKVFDDEKAFLDRAKELFQNFGDVKLASTESIFNTIKAVSL